MELLERVKAVRRFNRFYIQKLGLLNKKILHSPFSLTEARMIYELAHGQTTTATQICEQLSLDTGYVSRILRGFQNQGLVEKYPAEQDARQSLLQLTPKGQQNFSILNDASNQKVERMLAALPEKGQHRLVEAIKEIEAILDRSLERPVTYILRSPQPGDWGWIIQRHGQLYAREYGWNEQFEALVAEIVAELIQNYDTQWERCWIAEKDGENVGSVCLVKTSKQVAKIRLLLVEPSARGLGLGTRLVDECITFARHHGYRKITLWTCHFLDAARHIYQKAGFRLVHEEAQQRFGHDWIAETWDMEL
ncbi:bifunctional helix-turn-helix transcriptional regulator/GNAT family N-acetyltransferase [Myxosarcina sp. GI1(2024)]